MYDQLLWETTGGDVTAKKPPDCAMEVSDF